MQIDAVIYYQITDPKSYVYGVTNPLKALGYKLYRTFNMIRENDQAGQTETKQFSAIA